MEAIINILKLAVAWIVICSCVTVLVWKGRDFKNLFIKQSKI